MWKYIFLLYSVHIIVTHSAEFPDYLSKCNASDPTLNLCLRRQANIFMENTLNGDENLGLPSLNPVKIPRFLLTPIPEFSMELKNCNGYGFPNASITDIKMNLKLQTLEFVLWSPSPEWDCIYRATGDLFNTTYDDRGFINITFVNCTVYYSAEFETVELNNQLHYQLQNDATHFQLGRIVYSLAHADGTDETQAKQLNKTLNEEYSDFTKELIPSSRIISSTVLTQLINNILREIPVDQLFLT